MTKVVRQIRSQDAYEAHQSGYDAAAWGLRAQVEAMLREAQSKYSSAAAMHAMARVSHEGGKIEALKAVLVLL